MFFALAMLVAYFLGSIPTAYWVGKKLHGLDIRKHGSGNIGTTNAFRVLGKGPGIVVLLIDIFKGYFASLIGLQLGGPELGLIAAIIAMAGHSWSVFVNFKGGKGVATGAGAFLALMPQETLIAILFFVIIIYITRYVSLGSIIAAGVFPILTLLYKEPFSYNLFALTAAVVIIYRHIPNIKRLMQGTENKIGRKL